MLSLFLLLLLLLLLLILLPDSCSSVILSSCPLLLARGDLERDFSGDLDLLLLSLDLERLRLIADTTSEAGSRQLAASVGDERMATFGACSERSELAQGELVPKS